MQTVAVWLAEPALEVQPGDMEWFDADELRRARAFMFERDRSLYVAAHRMRREILAKMLGAGPEALAFATSPGGKPYVACPACDLSSSLSHTQGLVAFAAGPVLELGVDVEEIRPLEDLVSLSRATFSRREAALAEAIPASRQLEFFYSVWTLKEAYLKARGLGLAVSLSRLGFDPELATHGMGRPRAFWTSPLLGDLASAWEFRQWRPTSRHVAAVAWRRQEGKALDIEVRWTRA